MLGRVFHKNTMLADCARVLVQEVHPDHLMDELDLPTLDRTSLEMATSCSRIKVSSCWIGHHNARRFPWITMTMSQVFLHEQATHKRKQQHHVILHRQMIHSSRLHHALPRRHRIHKSRPHHPLHQRREIHWRQLVQCRYTKF